MSRPRLRVGITQWAATPDVAANTKVALALIERCGADGAEVVVLPENGLCLGTNTEMRAAALRLDAPEIAQLADAATAAGSIVVLGGMKRLVPGREKVRNSAVVIAPRQGVVGAYDKIHLFDATVGGQRFAASDVEEAGDHPVTMDVGGVTVGLTICYDVRFPDLHQSLAAAGAELLLVPAAFSYVTGSAHWEVLLRARAIENLSFVVAPATIRGGSPTFETWGHAMVVGPWGEVMADLDDADCAAQVLDLDLTLVDEARAKLPVLNSSRPTVYRADVERITTGDTSD